MVVDELQPNEPQFSPRELNQQLAAIYVSLPTPSLVTFEDVGSSIDEVRSLPYPEASDLLRSQVDLSVNAMRRRRSSDVKKIVTSRMKELLERSCVTAVCRQYLVEEYERMYVSGVERDENGLQRFAPFESPVMLELNDASGGIFDPITSQGIERALYRSTLYWHVGATSGVTPEQMQRRIDKGTPSGRRAILLAQWRQEYIEKYQDEP